MATPNMPLIDLYVGPKRPFTTTLREDEFEILDRLTEQY